MHELGDRRPLHLDDHVLAGDAGVARVHLGDRRRGERLAVERGEHLLERRPSSASTTARTSSNGSGGTWSRHFLNSLDQLLGEEALAATR